MLFYITFTDSQLGLVTTVKTDATIGFIDWNLCSDVFGKEIGTDFLINWFPRKGYSRRFLIYMKKFRFRAIAISF
jgi:hypothetical protein